MNKTFLRRIFTLLMSVFFISFVISCEEDFTDIRTNIVGNNDFTTNDTTFNVVVTTRDIDRVQSDGLALGGALGQYLLGVYNNENYEKIEASIITQLDIPFNPEFDDFPLGPDNDTISSVYTIDRVYLKIPYQATLEGSNASGPVFRLDSIIGDREEAFSVNVFRLSSFLNDLNPSNPTQQNTFFSDDQYGVFPEVLHIPNTQNFSEYRLIPDPQDTVQFVSRRNLNGDVYKTDTISLTNSNPFIAIPIKNDFIQQEFLDKYTSGASEFSSQNAFNNFFRGLYIEAKGDQGSLISLDFSSADPVFTPSLEIFYTRTSTITGSVIRQDSITPLNDSFQFNEIRNSQYKMTPGNVLASNQAKIQGTAGSYVNIDILGDDVDQNGIPDQLDFLRTKNWLINDARITIYVDQNTVEFDTLATPFRLFVFKDNIQNNQSNQSQLLDYITEGTTAPDGNLRIGDDKKPDHYVFNITDFISELVSGEIDYLPTLGAKVLNPTDFPVSTADTVIRTYNWNPKAVMLLNHMTINGDRRPKLKISYTEKIEDN